MEFSRPVNIGEVDLKQWTLLTSGLKLSDFSRVLNLPKGEGSSEGQIYELTGMEFLDFTLVKGLSGVSYVQ
jgi:hypothetical protein